MIESSMKNLGSLIGLLALSACTHHIMIEPSDKPFVVNLNVKIDHEVKLEIQEKNQDLLNLEEQVLSSKPKTKRKS
ncbi:MAG: YnbE family lipoprotein [Bdellovibrionota bacterium]